MLLYNFIGQVIKGMELGVIGMKVGGRRQIVVPSQLGYGIKGAPPKIPSNSDLRFDVQVVSIG